MPIEVPKEYRCSITGLIYFNAVSTVDGHTYEKEAIVRWFKTKTTSPITGKNLASNHLNPNQFAQTQIAEWLAKCISQEPNLSDEIYFPCESMISTIEKNDKQAIGELIRRDQLLVGNKSRFLTKRLHDNEDYIDSFYQEYTAFHLACEKGSPELVKFFLALINKQSVQQQLQIFSLAKPSNWSPVHLNQALLDLVKEGNEELVKVCLRLWARIQTTDKQEHHCTPLHLAVKYNHSSMVIFLLSQGAKLEATAIDGSTPLNFSAFYGKIEPMRLLLDAGAAIHHQDNYGNTALHDAVQRDQEQAAKLLLSYGASKHIKNKEGLCALEVKNNSTDNLRPLPHKMAGLLYNYSFSVKREKQEKLQQKLDQQVHLIEQQARQIEEFRTTLEQLSQQPQIFRK